jgi:hypothetical protein
MAFLARVLPRPLRDLVLFLDVPLTSQAPGQRSWLPPAPPSGLGFKYMASRKRFLHIAKTHLGYSLTSRAVYRSLNLARLLLWKTRAWKTRVGRYEISYFENRKFLLFHIQHE